MTKSCLDQCPSTTPGGSNLARERFSEICLSTEKKLCPVQSPRTRTDHGLQSEWETAFSNRFAFLAVGVFKTHCRTLCWIRSTVTKIQRFNAKLLIYLLAKDLIYNLLKIDEMLKKNTIQKILLKSRKRKNRSTQLSLKLTQQIYKRTYQVPRETTFMISS